MAEQDCTVSHATIDEAIAHAREALTQDGGVLDRPFWGTRGGQIANVGWVIGYQSADGQRRFRLDYDPAHGVHVNEEDFSRPVGRQKVRHRVSPPASGLDADAEASLGRALEGWMQLYWKKWTSRYDKPPEVLEAEREVDRRHRGG
jgi:hypothetical protein